MKTTITHSPARLQADDAQALELIALVLDSYDIGKPEHTDRSAQIILRRIAQYLREAFPNTINQPNQQKG